MADRGCLLIADITGYTAYLNESELEHAQDSLASLIRLLITHTRPPLAISRLEGDAVISYAIDGSFIQGQLLVDMIEETYVSFQQALEGMVMNTTCTCNACRNIGGLDLKFFVHHGEFVRQSLGGHDELVGRDVNIVHRLTKNTVTSVTGMRAYTLYTRQTVEALGLQDFAATLTPHREAYPDVGELDVVVQDMAPVWQQARERVRQRVTPEQAVLSIDMRLPLPPALAWDYISNPRYRAVIVGSDSAAVSGRNAGRISEGTVYICAHGKSSYEHTVVDWHPFDEVTVRAQSPLPGTDGLYTISLAPDGEGTLATVTLGPSRGPFLFRTLDTLASKVMGKRMLAKGTVNFIRLIEKDIADGVVVLPTPAPDPATEAIAAAARESLAGG